VEIQEYVKILWKRGWIIVLLAVITAASAYGFSKRQTPEYKGSTKLLFRPARADWGLQNAAKGLLPSYREFIKKDETADEVIDRLRLDMSRGSLLAKVTTSADEATFAIQIDARDHYTRTAGDISWNFAQVFKEEQDTWNQHQDIRDQVEVYVAWKEPRISLFKPRTKINTLAGGIFGVMLGVVIAFFLEWLESDIVRTAEDVERHVGVAVLGSIPVITSEEVVPVRPRRKRRWSFLRSFNLSTVLVFGAGSLAGAVIASLALTIL
jgi:capsular polysaccharide biosynthesis protein